MTGGSDVVPIFLTPSDPVYLCVVVTRVGCGKNLHPRDNPVSVPHSGPRYTSGGGIHKDLEGGTDVGGPFSGPTRPHTPVCSGGVDWDVEKVVTHVTPPFPYHMETLDYTTWRPSITSDPLRFSQLGDSIYSNK